MLARGGVERESEGHPSIYLSTLCSHSPFPLHPLTPPLHQLVARARRLVVFYCVLCGPVHRDGPDQAAAADFKEIYEVSDAAVTTERHERGINAASLSILYIHI